MAKHAGGGRAGSTEGTGEPAAIPNFPRVCDSGMGGGGGHARAGGKPRAGVSGQAPGGGDVPGGAGGIAGGALAWVGRGLPKY